jgi:hypothetical protein
MRETHLGSRLPWMVRFTLSTPILVQFPAPFSPLQMGYSASRRWNKCEIGEKSLAAC